MSAELWLGLATLPAAQSSRLCPLYCGKENVRKLFLAEAAPSFHFPGVYLAVDEDASMHLPAGCLTSAAWP